MMRIARMVVAFGVAGCSVVAEPGPSGDRGPRGEAGPAGPRGERGDPSPLDVYDTYEVQAQGEPDEPTAVALCHGDDASIGGGCTWGEQAGDVVPHRSRPTEGNGWLCEGRPTVEGARLYAHVLCVGEPR